MKIKTNLISFLAALMLFWGGQAIWAKAADVVWFETSEVVSVTIDEIQLRIKGYKVRDCAVVPDSVLGYMQIKETGVRVESKFQFIDDHTPNSSKPRSWRYQQSFGVWEWRDNKTPPREVSHVLATIGHDCGPAGLRTTTIGPFRVEALQ